MIERLPDWEQRLHDYVSALEGASFAWGTLDCALFAAGAVRAQTGVDPAADFRDRYRSAAGSVRALRRFGAGTLAATIDARLPGIAPAFARRGDIVMTGGIAGVCLGARALFVGEVDGQPGWVTHARPAWQQAWKVG
ncbi:hypothetical protein GCM10022253_19400 [Sphingomonas endophytica]|uniref:DUF6950 domain-containing protein n=1 Tax=Sphingomonas endophytica TaxID=869719 RepID=A0ABR6N954_9SPHN|nr:hypothetical protein [Sphingomonas endophytica]MBB5727307.1 hypothetical protein [Sphingomonas endophytica]